MTESSRTYLYCFFMMIMAILTMLLLRKLGMDVNPYVFLGGWSTMEFAKFVFAKIREFNKGIADDSMSKEDK